ncbi:MAG: SUMF1/EgtB/PvdO family nonheme iron enzyme [Methyloligellaceae bacterium]
MTSSKQNKQNNKHTRTAYSHAVRYFRQQVELTQEKFADACGVGKTTLQDIESGKVVEPQLDTIKRLIIGLQAQGLDIDQNRFDSKVREYASIAQAPKPEGEVCYSETPYKQEETQGREDLDNLVIHLGSARGAVQEIQRQHNNEVRFVRGMTNILNRIEKMAAPEYGFKLEGFCELMQQFDRYVQEAERRQWNRTNPIYSLQDLRQDLKGFQEELTMIHEDCFDGRIPNGWPHNDVKHLDRIEKLHQEIKLRKLALDDIAETEAREKALDVLEALEIELDADPLLLPRIDAIAKRLEELDRDVFKDIITAGQLLLGKYAELLPAGMVFRDMERAPEMVIIPAGEFMMGSAEGAGIDTERPQHKVTLASNFAVGRYPVTFEEWDFSFENKGVPHNPEDQGWGRDRRPVIRVSFDDILYYIAWLSGRTAKNYHLLSEAQWEYACRAGMDTEYHFGDDEAQLGEYAWYRDNSEDTTHPVGLKKPNQFGLYDMHGNVYEWCEDHWHEDYTGGPDDGSAWTEDNDENTPRRVLRGGSWYDNPQILCARSRSRFDRDSRGFSVGFRVARALASS